MKYSLCFSSPIGFLTVREENDLITEINFKKSDISTKTPLLCETKEQLTAYFNNKLTNFSLPILISGTEFQQSVYETLLKIPYGCTVSYKDIAREIGNPEAARAVGNANNKNKIPIIIPCHRVIGSNGSLTGYAGGLEIKKYLIDLEANYNLC